MYLLGGILLYFGQEYILFHPVQLAADYKYNFEGDNFHEHFVEAQDGEKINAVWFDSDSTDSKGVVIYHHGNTGNIQMCGWHHKQFTSMGYDCVIWDYRSYGKTPGPRNEDKFYSDALTMYDWVNQKYTEDSILVWASSLGTGFAIYTASQRKPRTLVLEAPYYSVEDVGTSRYPYPAFIVKYPLRSDLHFPGVKCESYLFHGTADQTIYWESSQKLAALNASATFVKLDGVGHNNISKQPEYQSFVKKLLR